MQMVIMENMAACVNATCVHYVNIRACACLYLRVCIFAYLCRRAPSMTWWHGSDWRIRWLSCHLACGGRQEQPPMESISNRLFTILHFLGDCIRKPSGAKSETETWAKDKEQQLIFKALHAAQVVFWKLPDFACLDRLGRSGFFSFFFSSNEIELHLILMHGLSIKLLLLYITCN